ncbi:MULTISPECIES: flagellar hook-length control protein FliK [unclassified Brevundimonas]|uniref:flagellar hook-length control protein FliK n=1 Tax=unclassified Brevundimonas TaxID=2622653 RepID=UPI0025C6BFE0|nr:MULTISPECIES: flagellar hook-length control protein FliK [unclassified Brevundimonas]
MTGTALNGAVMTAASDSGTDTDAAMSGAFSDMLNTFGAKEGGAETETDSEASPETANPMGPTPVIAPQPVPTRLVMDLQLTEDAAAALVTDTDFEGGKAGNELAFAPVAVPASPSMDSSRPQAAEAAEAAAKAAPTAGSMASTDIDAPLATDSAPAEMTKAAPAIEVPRPDLPERLRNVPRKEDLGLTTPPSDPPAPEQAELTATDAEPIDDGLGRDAERLAERLPQRPATLPQGTVTPLQVETARKYAADSRLETDLAQDISGDTAGNAAISTDDAAPDNGSGSDQPSNNDLAKPALETAIGVAATAPDGEVMEADTQRVEQTHIPETHTADSKGSLLSQATLRTTAELAAAMIHRLGHRTTRFDMVLTPETLGNVEVSIEVGPDGQMSARLAFDNPQAAQEMRARADELRRQLAEAGFDVSEKSLEFTDRESDPRGGFNQFLSDGRSGRRAFVGATRLAELADTPVVPVWTPQPHARTGVDMKV